MFYKITNKDLDKLNFNNYYCNIIPINDNEFYGKEGEQHYRLLSYFSTLFNNSNIIDLGTHRGSSALALSYNKTNTIHTFDIFDKVLNKKIKEISNIKFYMDDLFNENIQEKFNELVLSCPFIFMDVDPHNGIMEIDFYNYLKKIKYKGFLICDDIWYFKEMRDKFWYKIDYKERYDLTDIGHWSGTGIISFNKEISFYKNNNDNWTLVTAYFNLTKCPDASKEIIERDANYYTSHSLSTLSLPYNLVIYCDKESYENIEKLRPKALEEKTEYIICDFDSIRFKKEDKELDKCFRDYRDIINNNRKKNTYHFDPRNTASYYLFCLSRYNMLKEVIKKNTFKSTHFCWINFCIERMGYKNLIRLDECLSIKRDKFSTCYIDYIPPEIVFDTKEYFKWGRCGMCSGFFTGNAEYMYKVCDLIENKFLEYLEKGYGHADEQLYSPVYFENIDLFEHYYGDYQQMITNYVYIYDAPEAPIHNFINKSFIYNNLEKCIEACEFVLKSYKLGKCVINNIMLEKLHDYYIKSKFNIFNEYYFNNNYLSEEDESILCYNLIKKYLDSSNNLECYKYSTKFIKLIEKYKIKNYKIYFTVMFMQYVSSYYIDKKICKEILANIYIICKYNENFRKEYESNKIFYDEQFKYINYIINKKLVYYTCYFGGENNYSKLIPPIPSNDYDSYFFTNNKNIYDKLENTKYIRIFVKYIPIFDDELKDTMNTKEIRSCPHKYNILNYYDYICWHDTKLEIKEEKVLETLNVLEKNENKIIALNLHPYNDKFNSVWDEYQLCIKTIKYNNEAEKYKNYIINKVKEGFDDKTNRKFYYGGFSLRKNTEKTILYNEDWFKNINECGIEDQISLHFTVQKFSDAIHTLSYHYTCKYFYE